MQRLFKPALLETLITPRFYLGYWAETYAEELSGVSLNTLILDHAEDIQAYNMKYGSKVKRIPVMDLTAAYEEYIKIWPTKRRKILAASIPKSAENLAGIRQWVKAVTGAENDDDVYIMAHWVWLVKRNLRELPVVHHIMPIITSPKQGGGKSTAVQRLVEPLAELMLELKVPQVVDERSFSLFTNYLIGFFDEMAGAEKVEIADFKRNVTSSTLTYRPMRTNTHLKIPNLCSFIGATNNALFDIIKDTSGIRRFFPINALEMLDHESINNIDYVGLWTGVDEARERGYFELVKDTVAQKQDELSMKDEVQLFVEDHQIIPSNKDTKVVSGKHLYQEYLLYVKNAGIRFPVTAQTFYKKLRGMGLQATKKADERRALTWYFAVSKGAVIETQGKLHVV